MGEGIGFAKHRSLVGGRRFRNNDEGKMALHEWLRVCETDSCGDEIFKFFL